MAPVKRRLSDADDPERGSKQPRLNGGAGLNDLPNELFDKIAAALDGNVAQCRLGFVTHRLRDVVQRRAGYAETSRRANLAYGSLRLSCDLATIGPHLNVLADRDRSRVIAHIATLREAKLADAFEAMAGSLPDLPNAELDDLADLLYPAPWDEGVRARIVASMGPCFARLGHQRQVSIVHTVCNLFDDADTAHAMHGLIRAGTALGPYVGKLLSALEDINFDASAPAPSQHGEATPDGLQIVLKDLGDWAALAAEHDPRSLPYLVRLVARLANDQSRALGVEALAGQLEKLPADTVPTLVGALGRLRGKPLVRAVTALAANIGALPTGQHQIVRDHADSIESAPLRNHALALIDRALGHAETDRDDPALFW